LADKLRDELEKRVEVDGIYFARRKDKHAPKWKLADCNTMDGRYDPNFKDVYLGFSPSGALKVLAEHIGLVGNATKFKDIELDKALRPEEYGYAPYANAIGHAGDWQGAWPAVIKYHIEHWHYNEP